MLRPLTSELRTIAENELNEDPNKTEEHLESIREWLKKQPHLNARLDDQWLISFFRGCKFNLQRVKEKLDCFYTTRTLLPDFYANRDPFAPEVQDILNAGILLPLPRVNDSVGPRIFFINPAPADPYRMSVMNVVKVFFMMVDILLFEDDIAVTSGFTFWEEFEGCNLDYVYQLTPTLVKEFVLCLQNAYPLRIKGMYVTSAPSVFESFFSLGKSFLNEKLRDRIVIYSKGTFKNIYQHIPKEILPNDFGGNNMSIRVLAAQWKKKVEGYKEWFLEDAQYLSKEELRTGSPRTTEDVFGVEGSFKKFDID